MTHPKHLLVQRLKQMTDVDVAPWKDADLLCVFFRGRDFAHFHGDDVLDIRLTPKIIQQEQLPRKIATTRHPDRSKNSRWIEVEFHTESDVERVLLLVRRACAETL